MPLFHCKSCHHEWEGAEDTWTCEWCGAQGYVLAPHTALENMLSAMQTDFIDGYEPLTKVERDAAIEGQIPPYAQLLGWVRRWEVTVRNLEANSRRNIKERFLGGIILGIIFMGVTSTAVDGITLRLLPWLILLSTACILWCLRHREDPIATWRCSYHTGYSEFDLGLFKGRRREAERECQFRVLQHFDEIVIRLEHDLAVMKVRPHNGRHLVVRV